MVDTEQIKQAAPGIIIVVALISIIGFIGFGDSLSSLGGITASGVCGENPIELDGQTFDTIPELQDYVEENGGDWDEVKDVWNPYVQDGKVYGQLKGEYCEE